MIAMTKPRRMSMETIRVGPPRSTATRPAEEFGWTSIRSKVLSRCIVRGVLSFNLAVKKALNSGSTKRAKIAAAFATMRGDASLGVPGGRSDAAATGVN
jgi:hypothetical protein